MDAKEMFNCNAGLADWFGEYVDPNAEVTIHDDPADLVKGLTEENLFEGEILHYGLEALREALREAVDAQQEYLAREMVEATAEACEANGRTLVSFLREYLNTSCADMDKEWDLYTGNHWMTVPEVAGFMRWLDQREG